MEEKVTDSARMSLLQKAMMLGHCAESRTAVHNSHGHAGKLMAAYFYYIKECTKKDFPKLPMLRSFFGKAVEPYGGYIDTKGDVVALNRMVFLGECQCNTTLNKYNVHQCWVRHDSKLEMCLTDHSHCHIDCHDNSSVLINAVSPNCKCKVRVYGNSRVTLTGHVECVTITYTNMQTY